MSGQGDRGDAGECTGRQNGLTVGSLYRRVYRCKYVQVCKYTYTYTYIHIPANMHTKVHSCFHSLSESVCLCICNIYIYTHIHFYIYAYTTKFTSLCARHVQVPQIKGSVAVGKRLLPCQGGWSGFCRSTLRQHLLPPFGGRLGTALRTAGWKGCTCYAKRFFVNLSATDSRLKTPRMGVGAV